MMEQAMNEQDVAAERRADPATAFRPVDLDGRPQVQPAPQAEPQLLWIPIADLIIDPAYQRELARGNWQAIQRIAGAFSWAKFAPVLVAPRVGGKFAIVDGQHRAHAALMCGFDQVPAMAVPMTPAEQAGAFAAVNCAVTRVSPYHILRAGLAAGEPWALACRAAVQAAGCDLMTYHASAAQKKPGQIYTVSLVRGLVGAGHGPAVTAGLRALRDYDASGRLALWTDYILTPWLRAVAAVPGFARADLAGLLARHDPFHVIERVNRLEGGNKGIAPVPRRIEAFAALICAARMGEAA